MTLDAQAARLSTNLPAPAARLIGRHAEIDALNLLLAAPETRIITVLAPGGMGKTLLALEVARQQPAHFADGVYLITLSAPTSADQLATLITQVLSCQYYPSATIQQEALNFLERQEMLLVLDNAEHAVDVAPFLSALLARAPSVKILATSQVSLNLYAETLFPLRGLGYGEEGESQEAESEAIELFVQRSKNVRPDFQLTPQSRAAVREICRLTQGMPLALVLAASWVALLSPEEIVRELERGFDFLETDLFDVPERQRSIRCIFNSTWALMPPGEQHILARLTVFRRGFTREAARVVAQGDLRSLMSLLKTAVLQPSSREGRYEVHELLRQYAAEHLLQSGEAETTALAHSRYFLDTLRQHERALKGHGQADALEALGADEENIRIAWEWAVSHEEFTQIADALEGLFWYCMMRTRYALLETLSRSTHTAVSQRPDDAAQLLAARITLRRWWMQRWREGSAARHPEILDELEALLGLFRTFDAPTEIALCMLLLGDAQRTLTDDLERATVLYQGAVRAFTDLGDDYYAAWAFHFYAKLLSDTQGAGNGMDSLQHGLALRRTNGDQIGVAYSLYNLSTDLLLLGRLEECAQVTDEILSVSRATGERSTLLMAEIIASVLAFLAGRFDEVRRRNVANHRLATNLDHGLGLAWTSLVDSLIEYLDGHETSALERLAASEGSAVQALVRYFVHLAYALMPLHDDDALKRHLLSAMHHADAFAAFGAQVWCLPPLAAWEANHGQPVRAVELLALAEAQPEDLMGWLPAWLARTSLQDELMRQVGAEAFATAGERGRALDVGTVIRSFLLANTAQKPGSSTIPAHVQEANQRLIEPLSDRELEVLHYIGRGLANREIANELVVELSTVKKHLTHVYGKLDVGTRAQAILRAQQLHLI